jgi:L-ascorbate metabolism protein UlaG (beta-lactamase superfamily)
MRFTYYGYNAFVVEGGGKTILVDPGKDLHWRRLNSLIPRRIWPRADLILVTHGDADHAEYVPQVARASKASLVCGHALAEKWRRKGLTVVAVAPGKMVEVAGVSVRGVQVQHGPLLALFGGTFTIPFIGVGAVGLEFTLENRRLLNLGDTLLLEDAWRGLRPDVLMVPIGGMMTMDVDAALRAVMAIKPGVVIPTHYDWDILLYHRSAEVARFDAGVRSLGCRCFPMEPGKSMGYAWARRHAVSSPRRLEQATVGTLRRDQ